MTAHQQVEAALTAYGLTFPETSAELWIPPARQLLVRRKTFCIFGEKDESVTALTLVMKLPVSAELAQMLPFVRESRGWKKQHNWVTAHFGENDDVLAELETLRGWLRQSYVAVAPRTLSRRLEG